MPKTIYFATGNQNKLEEVRKILHNHTVENFKLDIPEFQGERKFIASEKATFAFKKIKKPLFVEDVSFEMEALNELPGPYIKSFIEKIGRKGLADIAIKLRKTKARVVCTVAYADRPKPILFEGVVEGNIVMPRGKSNFGFDPIFVPYGRNKTFAEMGDEKNKVSHRTLALQKMKAWLDGS